VARLDPGRASLADFGNEDVAREEAAIESGAPLAIPAVPPIPTLPVQAANGELATVGLRGTRARPPHACGALTPQLRCGFTYPSRVTSG